MDFTVAQEESVIVVRVVLPKLQRDRETRVDMNRTVLRENHVRDYLRKSAVLAGKCVKVDNLDNMGDRLEAIWKFETLEQKKIDKSPKNVVSSTKTKRTRSKKRSNLKDE